MNRDEIINNKENLRRANLTGADLRRADLTGADLTFANLTGADLRGADLTGADLIGADLRAADLTDADLRAADLRGANLRGANLRFANLTAADLRRADLTGAKIHETYGLTYFDLDQFPVYISDKNIQIGCEHKTTSKFLKVTKSAATEMGLKPELYKYYMALIEIRIKSHFKMPVTWTKKQIIKKLESMQ